MIKGSRIKGGNMFLKPNVLNNLMKQAYKTGLVVARTTDNWIIWQEVIGKQV